MKKNLYIRVDINPIIATGHLMRCMSIAKAARKNNIDVTFLVADGYAIEILEKNCFKYIVLDTEWNDLNREIEIVCEVIRKYSIDTLLIDTYQVSYNYLKRVSKLTKTIYIDDINQFVYPVHAVICYANYYKKFSYEKTYYKAFEEGIIDYVPDFYLGCDYVPLREEFNNVIKKKINNKVDNVLILSGGSDPYNAIGQILDLISEKKYMCVNVVCGRYNTNYDTLVKQWDKSSNVHFLKSVDNLIDYMIEADIAISAGGSTLYELCVVGTPTVCYSYADNQLDNVKQFEEDGIMDYIGDCRDGFLREKIVTILEGYESKNIRYIKSDCMKKLVSPEGAKHIIEKCFK